MVFVIKLHIHIYDDCVCACGLVRCDVHACMLVIVTGCIAYDYLCSAKTPPCSCPSRPRWLFSTSVTLLALKLVIQFNKSYFTGSPTPDLPAGLHHVLVVFVVITAAASDLGALVGTLAVEKDWVLIVTGQNLQVGLLSLYLHALRNCVSYFSRLAAGTHECCSATH